MDPGSAPGGGAGPRLAGTVLRDGNVLTSTLEPIGEREPIGGLLRRNARAFAEGTAFREKRGGRFLDVSWAEFMLQVVAFGRFLRSRGVAQGDRVAVFSRNRGEMLITEFAVMSIGAVHTPIFAGYSAGQACALFERSGASVLIVADPESLRGMVLPERIGLVVSFDPVVEREIEGLFAGYRGAFVDFERACAEHAVADPRSREVEEFLEAAAGLDPFEVCLMMYTSGTSGALKGVLLTHDNILSQQRALARLWSITPEDRFLSYLPWHHSFGGIFEKYTALYNGAAFTIDESYGKDFPLLLENWKAVLPTVYFSVPKVYQELFSHVQTHPGEEAQVFHDALKFVFTAAAPLPANISDYFAAKGIPVVEGWGLTETSPCCTITDLCERREIPGMVGYPIPGVSLKLDEEGQILVKGPNVMRGYYEDPEATGRALPGDGWFRTGDLGEFAGCGLRLVSRRDRVFKLLNAEKIIPTALENKLAGRCAYIRHVVVLGAGREYPTALIYPNFFLIEQEFGDDRQQAEAVVKEAIRAAIVGLNGENPVKYEHINAFAVVSRELTVEGGELTPSMKVRVQNVLQHAQEYIEAIYNPSEECDCRFLKKVLRLLPDERRCFRGKDVTIDRCHECGAFIFEEVEGHAPPAAPA